MTHNESEPKPTMAISVRELVDIINTPPNRFTLFQHMSREHGLTLINSEMDEIIRIVRELSDERLTEAWRIVHGKQFNEYSTEAQQWLEQNKQFKPDDL